MWIIPNNLNELFPSVPASEVLSEDLNEQASCCSQSVMWRSKHFSLRTWWQRWKRVYWLPLLFGRIVPPSMQSRFVAEYTASLEVIRAPRSAWQESAEERKTLDTFGRLYEDMSRQYDLFGASSKTSMITSPWDSTLFTKTYALWVTQLRQEYSRRKKLARRMRGNDCSSWLSPRTTEAQETRPGNLSMQVNWPTASARDFRSGKAIDTTMTKNSRPLNEAVINWPTPTFAGNNNGSLQEWGGSGNKFRGQRDTGNLNTNGNTHELSTGRLNASWVLQLMGTTLERTFFVPLATQLLNNRQNLHTRH